MLTSMSTVTSASSPSSPLTHQQLQEAYQSQSLPKSKTYHNSTQLQRDVLLLATSGKSNFAAATAATAADSNNGRNLSRQRVHQTLQHDSNAETSTDYDDDITTTIDELNNKNSGEMYAAAATTATVNNGSNHAFHQHHQHQQFQHHRMNQSIGVAVLPPIGGGGGGGGGGLGNRSRNFITERQKLRSTDDSSHDLDSSENDSAGPSIRRLDGRSNLHNGSSNSGDITDSQRSLSEGRLVDSDFTREGLSQSHDSVFSESATASSLSIVLRAELADVLRKRRTRPDGSDEDLGLPRSPSSPQRRAEHTGQSSTVRSKNGGNAVNANQSQVSSMSLLSMTSSNECDDFQATSTANNSLIEQHQSTTQTTRYVRSATFSSMPAEILRQRPTMSLSFTENRDEVDVFGVERQVLSHAAAKHKMAIRPVKKNVPTRQHRRTLERAIPEANEDLKPKVLEALNSDHKSKSKSLPPGVNAAKLLEQTTTNTTTSSTPLIESSKSSTTITTASSNTLVNSSSNKSNSDSETFTSSTKISSGAKMFGFLGANKEHQSHQKAIEKQETSSSTSVVIESADSGFLRRLMQRNSKRNYAKANAGDETDLKNVAASEPKKMPISNSCIEVSSPNSLTAFSEAAAIDKVKSAMSYEQSVEETRKIIKREIKHEGTNGLSAILNNFSTAAAEKTTAAGKPKSGAASRQRYVPQEIPIPQQESFQSTSIVRDINNKAAASASPHHHFEKKPKIVGLSAFQQKISRSNDSVVRLSASNNSLESSTDDLLRDDDGNDLLAISKRKTVEKSRSFRTYNEVHEESYDVKGVTSRHNMPSLPDLSVNLRVPNYTQSFVVQSPATRPLPTTATATTDDDDGKCASLGFEINDNSLLKPQAPRNAESAGNIHAASAMSASGRASSPHKHSLIVTTNSSGGSNVLPPQLSPGNSCQTELSEIEQNIDMIVKSPFVSVIRKSANFEQQVFDIELDVGGENNNKTKLPQVEIFEGTKAIITTLPAEQKRPRSLAFKTKSEEQLSSKSTSPTTPTTAAVPLRGRLKSSDEVKSAEIREKEPPQLQQTKEKDLQRKSAPAPVVNSSGGITNLKFAKRSASMNDSETLGANETQSPTTQVDSEVPEFMKIQLNHVDKARFSAPGGNVVLAKNVKEPVVMVMEKSEKLEKPFIANTSNDSVIITECAPSEFNEKRLSDVFILPASKPPTEKRLSDALTKSKPEKRLSDAFTKPEKRLSDSLPKSPTKKLAPTPPNTPLAEDETKLLRPKAENDASLTAASNKLSILERKRLFMGESSAEKPKIGKKIEDIRSERKKSMSEEVFRKLSTCGQTKVETKIEELPPTQKAATPPTTPLKVSPLGNITTNTTQPSSPVQEAPNVILRKKSFAASNSNNSNASNNNGNSSNGISKEDSTPELMKVFARRSLKVKDEDIAALTEKLHEKKLTSSNAKPQQQQQKQQLFDSDKENQSSSEEKLNKLAVDLEQMTSVTKITNHKLQTTNNATTTTTTASTNNRNSVADFRHNHVITTTTTTTTSAATTTTHVNNNNHKSNNIVKATIANGAATATTTTIKTTVTNGNLKPEIKTNEQLNNNNVGNINNNNNNSTKRQSLNIMKAMESLSTQSRNITAATANVVFDKSGKTTTATVAAAVATPTATLSNNKPIERSATVSEFKGIHQRRAEWERRAKEALK